MQWSMLLIWGGALLVLSGVVYAASQAIRRGRLSDDRPPRSGVATDTLEPRGRNSAFGLKANWPGLALIAFGSILLLAGASI